MVKRKDEIKKRKSKPKKLRRYRSKKGALPRIPLKSQMITIVQSCSDMRFLIIYTLGCFLALRIGSIIRLEWDHVNFELNKIGIFNDKNVNRTVEGDYGCDRYLTIPHFLVPILKSWKAMNRGEEYIIPRDRCGAKEKSVIRFWEKRYHAYYKSLGMLKEWLPTKNGVRWNFNAHTPRHIGLTNLYLRGMPIGDIQEFAGHKDIKTTMRYIHIAGECMRKSIEMAYQPDVQVTIQPEVKTLVYALRQMMKEVPENGILQQQIV